jgi:hypothetical protein
MQQRSQVGAVRRRHILLGVIGFALAAAMARGEKAADAAAPAAAPSPEKWVTERLQFEEPVKAGTPIRITNPLGAVQVRRVRDPKLPVFAIIQHEENMPAPKVKLLRGPSLHLTVEPPAAAARPDGTSTTHRAACRADLSVFIPDGSPLLVETTRGAVTIKGIRAEVAVTTVSGRAEIFADGPVRAETRSGDIIIIFRTSSRWTHDMELSSVSGNIVARMPRPADCRVRVVAGGELTSDFSAKIRQPVDLREKTADIRVADSPAGARGFWGRVGRRLVHPLRHTPRLTIKTEVGAVKVLRAPPGWIGVQEDAP